MSQNIRFSLLIGALLVSGLAMLFSAFGPWTEKESHYVEQIWRERSKNWSLASRGKLWNQRKALREAGRRLLVPSRGSLDSLDLKWSVIRIHNRSWGEESLKARFQAKAFEPEDWHAEIFERDQNYLHVIESVPVVVNGRSTQYFVQGLIRSEAILPSEIQLSHSRLLVQEKLNPKDSSRDHEQSSRFYLVGDAKSNKQFQLALEKKWQNKEVADSKSDDEEVSFNWIEIMQNNYSRNFAMRVDRLENSPLWLMTMVPESEMVTVSKGSEWKFFTALFLFLLFFISFFYVSYRYIVLRLGSISQVLEPLLNFGQQTEGDSSSKRQFNFSQNRWRLFSLLKGLDQLGNDVHVAHKKRKARMREEIFSQSNIERQTWLEDWGKSVEKDTDEFHHQLFCLIEESQGNAHKESLSSFATRTASSWAKFRNKVLSAPSSAHYLTNPEFHVQDLELCVLETLLKGRSYFEHKNQKIHLKAHKDAFLVNMDVALFQESLKWILLHLADCTPESSKIELEVLALNSKDSFKLGEELIRDQLIVGDFSRLVIRDLSGGLAFPNKPLSDSYAGERNESINLNLAWRAWVKHEMRWSWTKKDALGSVFYLDFNSKGARWEADINRCQKLREVFFHGASLEDVIGGELKDPDLARDLTAKKTTFNHLSQSAFELRAPLRGNQGKDKREKASSSVHSTAFSLAGETNSEVSK